MGIFDWLFDPTENKSKSTTQLPAWVEEAGKTNYTLASQIAQKPYQAYGMPRIAPFSADQNSAKRWAAISSAKADRQHPRRNPGRG
jgi:hypothetical protein